jgi:CheY-specific phosphatase CheX
MNENLQKRKKEIIEKIGEDEIKELKKVKMLKLIQNEIQELLNYWNIKQVHELVQNVFNIPISSPLFYRYCAKNIKKDEKIVVSQKVDKVDIKKSESSIQNIDELTNSTLDFLKNLPKK